MRNVNLTLSNQSEKHRAFRKSLIYAVGEHDQLRTDEVLATMAYFIGQFVAAADGCIETADALELITQNVRGGYADAKEALDPDFPRRRRGNVF